MNQEIEIKHLEAAVLTGHGKKKCISLPVQTKERREMYMRPQRANHGSSPIPL